MNVQKQIDQLLSYRAAEWFDLMMRGEPDQKQNDAFIAWVSESPRHMAEILKIAALSRETRNAIASAGIEAEPKSPPSKITSLAAWPSAAGWVETRKRTTFWRWTAGLAAATVFLVVAALWLIQMPSLGKRYETAVGELRTIDLADGSVIFLNARSNAEVDLGETSREIRLEGEALFKVAKDPHRPFRVRTRDAVVQALGTQFNVSTHGDGTHVAVLEGQVQVSTESQRSGEPQTPANGSTTPAGKVKPTPLAAGEALRVSRTGDIERGTATDAANATAWRERKLILEGTPLEEAVEEFNRYHRRLRLEGIAPGSRHYSGTFDANDPESFADLLSRERDLRVEKLGDEIIIRPRER